MRSRFPLFAALAVAVIGGIIVPIGVLGIPTSPALAYQSEQTSWVSAWDDSECTISTGDPGNLGIEFRETPGDPGPEVKLFGASHLLESVGKQVTVVLEPGGETFRTTTKRSSVRSWAAVDLSDIDYKFSAPLARSSQLRVISGRREFAVSLAGADHAMAALNKCVDEKLAQWGVDPKAWDALKEPPTDIPNYSWIAPDDYPAAEQFNGLTGKVVVRMNVNASGKVMDCATLVSSGRKSFDAITCQRALERAKFNPAIGTDGKPTAAFRVVAVNFILKPLY